MATHPSQSSGYSRVANKISNHLASIDGIQVIYFAFQNYKNRQVTDRFVDPRIKFYDAYEIDTESPLGFGDNIIVPTLIHENPDVIFIYNDIMVTLAIMNIIPTEHMPKQKYVYLDIVYPWQDVRVYQCLQSFNFNRIWVFLDYWRTHLINDMHFSSNKVFTMSHGIDFDKFVDIPIDVAKKLLGYHHDDFLVINMNRNTSRKCIDITLQAFLEFLKRENMNPRIKLYLGGLLYVEESHDIIKVLVTECKRNFLNVDQIMTYHVFVNDIPFKSDEYINFVYNAADVGINTCRGEGFGLTSIEHIYFDRPQIVSGVPAHYETIGEYAHVIAPKVTIHALNVEREGGVQQICDYKDFADKLQYCFRHPDKKPYAREYIKCKYTWNNAYTILNDVFKT